jgi:hypothetical protein
MKSPRYGGGNRLLSRGIVAGRAMSLTVLTVSPVGAVMMQRVPHAQAKKAVIQIVQQTG